MTSVNPASEAIERIACLLEERAGLVFPENRRKEFETTVRHGAARYDESVPGYAVRLMADAGALSDLINRVTIGETYFFRDPSQFDFIRSVVLSQTPQMAGRPRIWSAGCASGEEAYSLAILAEEEGRPAASILATDISEEALARAVTGEYGPWSFRSTPAAFRQRYFSERGGRFTIDERFRRRVRFGRLNLAADFPDIWGKRLRSLDAVLCRNVLIYFPKDVVAAVANRLFECLADDGWLITGAADPPLQHVLDCETVLTPNGVFYRRRAAPRRSASRQTTPLLPTVTPETERIEAPVSAVEPAKPAAPTPEDSPAPIADGARLEAMRIRALADTRKEEATAEAATACARFPLSIDLRFLHAVLLADLGRGTEALAAFRQVLYLDPSSAMALFITGTLLERAGDSVGARRAYQKTVRLCRRRPADEPVPFSEGQTAGSLADAASRCVLRARKDA